MGDGIRGAHADPSAFGDGDALGNKKDDESYMSSIHEQWHQVPFLRMLQEPTTSFQLLLKLQEQRLTPEEKRQSPPSNPPPLLESCVTHASDKAEVQRERRHRKRCRPSRPAESHRRSHIEVERNRRRLMNQHLAALRSLMPPSFLPRVDQATVVAGAIDCVRGLEQRVQRLEAERRSRAVGSLSDGRGREQHPFGGFFVSPRHQYSKSKVEDVDVHGGCMDVEARVVQSHAHVRVATRRRQGLLARAISAMRELHLEVLHLCVASSQEYVLYTLSLKMMEECRLTSAEEIASAVHQIFTCISSMWLG